MTSTLASTDPRVQGLDDRRRLAQSAGVAITRRVHRDDAAAFEATLRELLEVASRQPQWIDAEILRGPTNGAVASLDDLIRSKEIADRPKDREALVELRRLRE